MAGSCATTSCDPPPSTPDPRRPPCSAPSPAYKVVAHQDVDGFAEVGDEIGIDRRRIRNRWFEQLLGYLEPPRGVR
jgi:hypothetical protein